MNKTSNQGTTFKIEWNADMTKLYQNVRMEGEESRSFISKGRCKECWGGLIGRKNEDGIFTGIRCRVCEKILEGEEANVEKERMSREASTNLMNMCFGDNARYQDGIFLEKLIPDMERLESEEFRKRILAARAQKPERETITRHSFPAGSAGLLYMQANLLIEGVGYVLDPLYSSIIEFDNFYIRDDGSTITQIPTDEEEIKKNPKYYEHRLYKKLGVVMANAMISAFACELAMKALSMTCNDVASKSHDLFDLYEALPKQSCKRMEIDFPGIRTVMQKGKQTFGTWKYLEKNMAEKAMQAMIDLEQVRALGKAARVILDEAETMGLSGGVQVKGERKGKKIGTRMIYDDNITVNINGVEAPPRCK